MIKGLTYKNLLDLYINKHKSAAEIAEITGCSENGVNYWIHKFGIKKRTLSDAIYYKHNPDGDPFKIKEKFNRGEAALNALGLGIYWGEGDKSPNNTSVRVGNVDPFLLKIFRDFLQKIYSVKEEKFKYGLILFNDANKEDAVRFWKKHIGIRRKQLGKITIIPPQGKGNYKKKSEYGVLSVIVTNKKLKEHILKSIEKYKIMPM